MFVFGFTFAAVCFACCKTGVYSAYISVLVSVIALLVFFFVRSLRKTLEIPLVAAAVLLSAVIFLLFLNLSYKKAVAFEGETAFTGKIISLPQKISNSFQYEIETESIGEKFVKLKLLYSSSEELDCDVYDCISISDAKIFLPKNADGKDSERYKSRGIYLRAYSFDMPQILFTYQKTPLYYVLMLRKSIINTVLESSSGDRAGIIIAMILGDTSYISPKTQEHYANSGTSHLLAVSGLHVSIWVSFLVVFLTIFGVKKKAANLISLLFLVFFTVVTGFSPSVIRASLMLAVILISVFFKRRGDSLNSLGLSVFLITAINPFAVLSVSLRLSVMATLGIITMGKYYCGRFAKLVMHMRIVLLKRLIVYVADIIIITVCAFISTLPVTVAVFGKVSLIAPLTNLLVVFLSSLTMIFGGLGVIINYSEIFMPVANLWFAIADMLAGVILSFVNALGSLTFSALPVNTTVYAFWLAGTALLLICSIIIFFRKKTRFPLEVTAAVCLVLFILGNVAASLPSRSNIRGTVLDVGGSPVIVLQNGRHYALLGCPRDSGGFEYELRRFIPQMPSTCLDLLLIPNENLGRDSYNNIIENYSPKEIFTDFSLYKENKNLLSDNVKKGTTAKYLLWGEVDISYYNTNNVNCVIIKFGGKTIMVSLCPSNDISKISLDIATADTLICRDCLPENPSAVLWNEIIITGNVSKKQQVTYKRALALTQNTYLTAYEGSVLVIDARRDEYEQA